MVSRSKTSNSEGDDALPPIEGSATQGASSHERLLRDSIDRIEGALAETELPLETRLHYSTSLPRILRSLTPEALTRHRANAKGFRFYGTHAELTKAFLKKYPEARRVVKKGLKGVFDKDGILHLNGDGELFGRPGGLAEFHAHEIAHSIDGNGHEISGLEAWQSAWDAEKGFLSANGKKTPSEGFAEFGQILLGSGLTRDQMRQVMPKCLAVWEEHGL